MMVVYASRTGNVNRFVDKLELGLARARVEELHEVDEPYILITYTTGFGQVPEPVEDFLQKNHGRLKGIAASGNRNWGVNFARSADLISARYQVPVLAKFELSGTSRDVEQFRMGVNRLAACGAEQ